MDFDDTSQVRNHWPHKVMGRQVKGWHVAEKLNFISLEKNPQVRMEREDASPGSPLPGLLGTLARALMNLWSNNRNKNYNSAQCPSLGWPGRAWEESEPACPTPALAQQSPGIWGSKACPPWADWLTNSDKALLSQSSFLAWSHAALVSIVI